MSSLLDVIQLQEQINNLVNTLTSRIDNLQSNLTNSLNTVDNDLQNQINTLNGTVSNPVFHQHEHFASEITNPDMFPLVSETINGIMSLEDKVKLNKVIFADNGKIDPSIISSLSLIDVRYCDRDLDYFKTHLAEFVSGAKKGDICVNTFEKKTYVLAGDSWADPNGWVLLEMAPMPTTLDDLSGTMEFTRITGDVPYSRVTDKPLVFPPDTALLGTAATKNTGTGDNEVVLGSDTRLTDSRKCDNTFNNIEVARQNLGLGTSAVKHVGILPGNVVEVLNNGKIDIRLLPSLAVKNTFVVDSQLAMLSLTAEVGDMCVRTDINKSYVLRSCPASVLSNWQELLAGGGVTSVAGRRGDVVLSTSDIQNLKTGATYDVGIGPDKIVLGNDPRLHNTFNSVNPPTGGFDGDVWYQYEL